MQVQSIKFQGYRCFKNDWSGFEVIKPINVIIGRNNTGKSHLLDFVSAICNEKLNGNGWRYSCSGILDEESLRGAFPETTGQGRLGGNWWREHGTHFVNAPVTWKIDEQLNVSDVSLGGDFNIKSQYGETSTEARIQKISELLKHWRVPPLSKTTFRRLLADRDIRPETADANLVLSQDGGGATNIIRRFIVTSNPKFPREIIQRDLLAGLNKIFGKDGQFDEIQVKHHDEPNAGQTPNHWEVYLGEKRKGGLIPLSGSGSGLKTVILVLLNLLVIPKIENRDKQNYTFAFEELENNLHPALLRRLFQYLEDYSVKEGATIFLTTHSSAALDLFSVSKNAQIIHVTHNGEAAQATLVSAHFEYLGVVSELGTKPSDLLQANGIVWVEGPSDRIYLNRWIELLTDGKWKEGRDYQCAFYGGALLARTQFKSLEEAENELVNLFRVNPNIAVVCDGDRTEPDAPLKDRVMRIQNEIQKIPNGEIWITNGKEIESYLPGAILNQIFETNDLPDPGQYEIFFPRTGEGAGGSYVEDKLKRKTIDKMELAIQTTPLMTKELMSKRFDLAEQVNKIIRKIALWNA